MTTKKDCEQAFNKYKKAKKEGIVRPLTILLDLDCWDIILKIKEANDKATYSEVVNELIRKGGAKK